MANLSIIKYLCKKRGITQLVLAEKSGISYQGLNRIMRTNAAKVSTLEKIAEALEVDISVFFNQTSNNNPPQNTPLNNFTANDIDGAYLLGVFNTSGMDGLSKELTRLKSIGLNPHKIFELITNNHQ